MMMNDVLNGGKHTEDSDTGSLRVITLIQKWRR